MTGILVAILPVRSETAGMRLMMGMHTMSASTTTMTTNHWLTTKSLSPSSICVGRGIAVPSGIISAILGRTTTDISTTTSRHITMSTMG